MLDWFSETMLKIVTSVPALFVAEDSLTSTAVRAMFGLTWGRCPICSRGNGDVEARSEGKAV
jgi:hypothetical protein